MIPDVPNTLLRLSSFFLRTRDSVTTSWRYSIYKGRYGRVSATMPTTTDDCENRTPPPPTNPLKNPIDTSAHSPLDQQIAVQEPYCTTRATVMEEADRQEKFHSTAVLGSSPQKQSVASKESLAIPFPTRCISTKQIPNDVSISKRIQPPHQLLPQNLTLTPHHTHTLHIPPMNMTPDTPTNLTPPPLQSLRRPTHQTLPQELRV